VCQEKQTPIDVLALPHPLVFHNHVAAAYLLGWVAVGTHRAVLLLLLAGFVDAGLLTTREVHEVQNCRLGVFAIRKKIYVQAVQSVTP